MRPISDETLKTIPITNPSRAVSTTSLVIVWSSLSAESVRSGQRAAAADGNKYPPAKPEVLRLLAPQGPDRNRKVKTQNREAYERQTPGTVQNFGSPPAGRGLPGLNYRR